MGKLNVRFTLDGQYIYDPGFGSDHPLFRRPEANLYYLFVKYPIGKMREIEFPGHDFTITFDAAQLSNDIDWTSLQYPSEEVKAAVLDLLYREGVRAALEDIKKQWNDVTSAYSLDRITEKAIDIIQKVRPKPDIEFYESYKRDAVENLLYTTDKEVERAKSAKRKNKESELHSAVGRLRADVDRFLIML